MLPIIKFKTRHFTVKDLMLGGAPLGNLFQAVPVEDARAAIRRAYECGIQRFDTAPLYGLGLSEELFGVELKHRSPVYIYTKVGRLLKPSSEISSGDMVDDGYKIYQVQRDTVPVFDFSAKAVQKSYEESLLRLQRTSLQCLRVHDADSETKFAAAMAPDGAVHHLIKLRAEGRINEVSAGLNDPAYLLRFAREAPGGTFDNFMCAGSWNLLDHSAYELLRECQARGIRVTNAGVFGSGILWGGDTLRYTSASPEAREKVVQWSSLAQKYSLPLPAVALHFALMPEVVDFAAIGCRNPAEVDANVALLAFTVPSQLWADAKAQGLLPDWMPIPT